MNLSEVHILYVVASYGKYESRESRELKGKQELTVVVSDLRSSPI